MMGRDKYVLLLVACAAIGSIGAWRFWPAGEKKRVAQIGVPIVSIQIPKLTAEQKTGRALYTRRCASCHGTNAAGQKGVAPPLVHKIYEPGHHADESFQRAAALGVRQHHWPFGNMPPVQGISRSDVAQIISYVRALQRANGIN